MAATASSRLAIRFVKLVSIFTPQAFYADVAVTGKTFHPGRFAKDIAHAENRGEPGLMGTTVEVRLDVTPRLESDLQQGRRLEQVALTPARACLIATRAPARVATQEPPTLDTNPGRSSFRKILLPGEIDRRVF